MNELTPAQRSLRSRLGGLSTAARGHVNTAPARAAFASRFYADLPEGLSLAERERRAEAAKRLYYARLAYKSVRSRSNKKAGPDRYSGPADGGRQGHGELPPAA